MSRFRQRLERAEARIERYFAEAMPAVLLIGREHRHVTVIFEAPDAPVSVPGGGEILDRAPAFSARTAALGGLGKNDTVAIGGAEYRVTHVGADEEGRTRVTLAVGKAGVKTPSLDTWS